MNPSYCIRLSYHKCLTHYMGAVFDKNKHFASEQKIFVSHLEQNKAGRFISINNSLMWPGRKIFKNAKMIHLIRHPKDIIISGYFYHKRGAELWNREPLRKRWFYILSFELNHILNDEEKKLLHPEMSYQRLLEALPFEKGMKVEMVWLKHIKTFNPIAYYNSPIIPTYRFEEIVENPTENIEAICQHWQLTMEETVRYKERALHFHREPNYPIRNRSAYQYKKYFDTDLNKFFNQHFHQIVKRLDYPD